MISALSGVLRSKGKPLDYLFVHPQFNRGGSEAETLAAISALKRINPKLRIGLITTSHAPSEWLRKLPKDVRSFEFGRRTLRLTDVRRQKLLATVLLENPPRVIHNVISGLCWRVFQNYGARLSKKSILIASSFCTDRGPRGKPFSLVSKYLAGCEPYVKEILCDNARHAREIRANLAFGRARTCYAPFSGKLRKPRTASRGREFRVLWAGRLDRQKMPHVLYLIALFNPEMSFDVYGSFVVDVPNTYFKLSLLRKLPNVRLLGGFHGFHEIPASRYDAFLYTSEWDGLPNVLLEATSSGLPIVAPKIGGIPELLNRKTGYLVSEPRAVEEYSNRLDQIRNIPSQAAKKVLNCQRILRLRHSRARFEKSYRKILSMAGL